ncbi:uncharacterized protein LOC132313588 [Cornus florida]|uniref:uncharacterized protein LOC132313588 n=1 Tax=Cornus florida TaxID=4283 RepID=UPI00289B8E34|nr:uncharacterized protein LOC132313588 [Cornus florida]
MGLRAKASEGWGMGFLFVFFPDDDAIIDKKTDPFSSSTLPSSSSSSSSSSFKPITTLRRSTSTLIFSRAQSTISICALLIFLSLLIFTLSTFEPSTSISSHSTSRRHLSSSIRIFNRNSQVKTSLPSSVHALQGLGTLYRRGTKAMNDLIVAHITESLPPHELRMFFRALHRSGLTSRSDLVFIYHSKPNSSDIEAIREENESFLNVMTRYEESNFTGVDLGASFDVTQFVKSSKREKEAGEPIWGRRNRSNFSEESETELAQLSYGSVVGFEFDELDPENSLAGFLDHVPLSLRRWACYPMLLGRVRRNFKHVMLVEVKEMLVLGDPLGRVRNRSPESVCLSTVSETTYNTHGKKNSVKTRSHNQELVNPAIIVGGTRGVRRLSNAMLTEIVRVTTQQHKRKNSVSDSGVFNKLVGNGLILKNVNLISS